MLVKRAFAMGNLVGRGSSLFLCAGCAALIIVRAPQARTAGPTDGTAPTVEEQPVTPPALGVHADPVYPPQALTDKREGDVGVEITIDEAGHVADARITQSAGDELDAAALTAVKAWTFTPAKRGETAIRSSVSISIPFRLPVAVAAQRDPASAPELEPKRLGHPSGRDGAAGRGTHHR